MDKNNRRKVIIFLIGVVIFLVLQGAVRIADLMSNGKAKKMFDGSIKIEEEVKVKVIGNKKNNTKKSNGKISYYQRLTVKYEELDIKEKFSYFDTNASSDPNIPFWRVRNGDYLKAKLVTIKDPDTGEIKKQYLDKLVENIFAY